MVQMKLDGRAARARLTAAEHAILCTTHEVRGVDAVPVCFAVAGDLVAIPVDTVKPKGSTRLQRVRNLERDPRAALLCEQWDHGDWSRLWWVRASITRSTADEAGRDELAELLRAKHPQYETAPFAQLLIFRISDITGWSAA
jgi:PPOX class probable F420-dependent enzyme